MIYITSDHGGFNLKKFLVESLNSKNVPVVDLGPQSLDPEDDYPDFVEILASKILEDPQNKGIVICRNGVGVSMAANKYKGIRATLSWDPKHAESARLHDNTNVLGLPADYIDEHTALEITEKWLSTSFSEEQRHIRRVAKVNLIN